MKNKRLFGIVLIFVFFVAIGAIYLLKKDNLYYKVETEMVEKAKKLISENNIKVENQNYIFLDELNVSGSELCMASSGVIVTNVENDIKYTPYLKCTNYESKILNNDKTYIKLNGSSVAVIPYGTLYLDDGYEKLKNVDVITVGDVIDEVGAYTLNYVIKENGTQVQVVKRIVIVTDRSTDLLEPTTKEEPTIVLNGEEAIVLVENENYDEPGFVAYDSNNGNLTGKVKVEGEVDSSKIGHYEITYSVKNSKGKKAAIKRVIDVVKKRANLEITADYNQTDTNGIIEFKVSGDGFNSVILPDSSESQSTINEYKVTENGRYTFKVVDIYGNKIYKTVVVSGIDKKAPTGECVASRKESEYVITVRANDNNGIKGVIYIINGIETGLFNSYQYKTVEIIEKAEAIIVDLSNNKTKISCKIND